MNGLISNFLVFIPIKMSLKYFYMYIKILSNQRNELMCII